MKVIAGGRRSGKTYLMMHMLVRGDLDYLVVANDKIKRGLIEAHPDMEERIVSFREASIGKLRGLPLKKTVGIDNLDMALSDLLGGTPLEVGAVSLTGEYTPTMTDSRPTPPFRQLKEAYIEGLRDARQAVDDLVFGSGG